MLGYCSIAIVLAIIAFNRAKKGKGYSTLLIVGMVLYAVAALGNSVGNADATSELGAAISIVLMVIMFPICKAMAKKGQSVHNGMEAYLP